MMIIVKYSYLLYENSIQVSFRKQFILINNPNSDTLPHRLRWLKDQFSASLNIDLKNICISLDPINLHT